jgi:hypothetical protein
MRHFFERRKLYFDPLKRLKETNSINEVELNVIAFHKLVQ